MYFIMISLKFLRFTPYVSRFTYSFYDRTSKRKIGGEKS